MEIALIILAAAVAFYAGAMVSKRCHSPLYEYGKDSRDDKPLRRNRVNGEVQFILWKEGEQGHQKDYWYRIDPSHWSRFKPFGDK